MLRSGLYFDVCPMIRQITMPPAIQPLFSPSQRFSLPRPARLGRPTRKARNGWSAEARGRGGIGAATTAPAGPRKAASNLKSKSESAEAAAAVADRLSRRTTCRRETVYRRSSRSQSVSSGSESRFERRRGRAGGRVSIRLHAIRSWTRTESLSSMRIYFSPLLLYQFVLIS